MFFIKTVKIRIIVEPHHETSLFNRIITSDEIIAVVQSPYNKIIVRRNTNIIPEQMGDVILGEMEFLCQNIQRYILRVVLVDVVDHFVDSFVTGGRSKDCGITGFDELR